jgi:hypothetical protein
MRALLLGLALLAVGRTRRNLHRFGQPQLEALLAGAGPAKR